ncbi:unnamed protein product [Microthlaspi erraticum]|uniref:Uncharacterized protein n=1 Tax=Microthlaspi erraticum TaxID=1685480 RepID=A0A6D2KBY2_9BRAS|nr:unnamed protein product [Microthlaspi erraticum]
MSIEMPRRLPFSVDTFGPYTTKKRRKRHHFLTCSQRPHRRDFSFQHRLPDLLFPPHGPSSSPTSSQLNESFFVRIETGQSVIVDDFKCTAFDANHCPEICS